MQPYEIRQSRDGSIDYNNYYARPVVLVTPAMRRFFGQSIAARAALVALAVVAVIAVTASASTHGGGRCYAPNSIWLAD